MARKIKNRAKGENTVIGAGTVVGGSIVSDSTAIRVDGKVMGGIDTKGDLIIGQNAEVNGDIAAFSLIMGGTVNGNVTVTHRVELVAGSKLVGDIDTEVLVIDETALYQGKITMRGVEAAKEADASKSDDSVSGEQTTETAVENEAVADAEEESSEEAK